MSVTGSITDASITWPGLGGVVRVLTLRAGFNTALVVIGTSLLGVAAGTVGTFALLRRRALVSDALSHAALPGLCAAYIGAVVLGRDGRSLPLLLAGAAASGVLGVLAIQAIVRWTRLREDAAIGAVLSVFFGAGVTLLSAIQSMPTGTQAGLSHFIYGQTAAMGRGDAVLIGGVALAATLVVGAFFKELRLICFDEAFAGVQGWPVSRLDLVLMLLVVLVTIVGLQAVGVILVVALLIIPPAAARFWTERLSLMAPLAAGLGGLSGYLGASASALLPRMPAGSVIVLVSGAIFGVSLVAAPARGVVAAAVRRARLRLRIAREHVLRRLYEREESAGRAGAAIALRGVRGGALARWLGAQGLVARVPGGVSLTERGRADAARLTRNHRLWEVFLVEHAHLASSHVDRAADMVEHVLSPELVEALEGVLRREGRLPATAAPGPSVHPIGAEREGDRR